MFFDENLIALCIVVITLTDQGNVNRMIDLNFKNEWSTSIVYPPSNNNSKIRKTEKGSILNDVDVENKKFSVSVQWIILCSSTEEDIS